MNTATDSRIGLLTRREKEVLALLTLGLQSQRIASMLTISTKTVINHLNRIYEKLGVRSRTEAVIYALSHGIAEIRSEK